MLGTGLSRAILKSFESSFFINTCSISKIFVAISAVLMKSKIIALTLKLVSIAKPMAKSRKYPGNAG